MPLHCVDAVDAALASTSLPHPKILKRVALELPMNGLKNPGMKVDLLCHISMWLRILPLSFCTSSFVVACKKHPRKLATASPPLDPARCLDFQLPMSDRSGK